MRKFDKKGFTIVELVIVIAVIAILAGVMIPTFSNLVQKANESARLQKVTAAYREAYAAALANDGVVNEEDTDIVVANGTFTFSFDEDGNVASCITTDGEVTGEFDFEGDETMENIETAAP